MNKTLYLKVDENESIKELIRMDDKLGMLIKSLGDLTISIHNDKFKFLVKTIIGQQLSNKAANTIFNRVNVLVNFNITPSSMLNISYEELRGAGVSIKKASYILDLAINVKSDQLNLNSMGTLNNNEVKSTLLNIKGIGIWSSDMFLIFSLGRMNILPLNDVALHRAVKWLYQPTKSESGRDLLELKSISWKPHFTIASLYLWEAVNKNVILKYEDIESLTQNSSY